MDFESRLLEATEAIARAMESNSQVSKAIESAVRELNEKFVLHQQSTETCFDTVAKEVNGIRDDFKAVMYPLMKVLVYAVIAIAGGTVVLKALGAV